MLGAAVWLMLGSILYSLRLSNGSGSFPKPLSAKEEQHYLALAAEGALIPRALSGCARTLPVALPHRLW